MNEVREKENYKINYMVWSYVSYISGMVINAYVLYLCM